METQLVFDSKARNLLLGFKEKFRTEDDYTLKVTGALNTVNGKATCHGSLFKHAFHGKRPPPSRKGGAQKDLRTRLGAGLLLDVDAAEMRAGVSAASYLQLGSPHTYVKAFGQAEYNVHSSQTSATGRVQLSKAVYGFTSDQDLKLTVGYRSRVNHLGDVTGEAFGEARENNWRLQTDFRGRWTAMYDL